MCLTCKSVCKDCNTNESVCEEDSQWKRYFMFKQTFQLFNSNKTLRHFKNSFVFVLKVALLSASQAAVCPDGLV